MDSANIYGYTSINIPATPLDLRANAHFGRVFIFIQEVCDEN